jgi:hypothetical protein
MFILLSENENFVPVFYQLFDDQLTGAKNTEPSRTDQEMIPFEVGGLFIAAIHPFS